MYHVRLSVLACTPNGYAHMYIHTIRTKHKKNVQKYNITISIGQASNIAVLFIHIYIRGGKAYGEGGGICLFVFVYDNNS